MLFTKHTFHTTYHTQIMHNNSCYAHHSHTKHHACSVLILSSDCLGNHIPKPKHRAIPSCDAPKIGGPLKTRQPAEYSWMSGNPTPLTKNQAESPLYGELYPRYNLSQQLTMTTQGPHASKIMATWAPASILIKYINYIQ